MKVSNKNRRKSAPVYEMGTGKNAFLEHKHNPPSTKFSVLVFTGFVLFMLFLFLF